MNCLVRSSRRQYWTRDMTNNLTLREEIGKEVKQGAGVKKRQNAHRWELLRLLKKRRGEQQTLDFMYQKGEKHREWT